MVRTLSHTPSCTHSFLYSRSNTYSHACPYTPCILTTSHLQIPEDPKEQLNLTHTQTHTPTHTPIPTHTHIHTLITNDLQIPEDPKEQLNLTIQQAYDNFYADKASLLT